MKCREMMFRKALLPVLEKPFNDECRSHSPNMHCFKGGDSRTNEQPGTLPDSCLLLWLFSRLLTDATIHLLRSFHYFFLSQLLF